MGRREKREEKEVVGKVLSRGFSRGRREEKLQMILAEAPIVAGGRRSDFSRKEDSSTDDRRSAFPTH